MKFCVKTLLIAVASVLLLVAPARSANQAEQVVFSTPGFLMDLSGNSQDATPFGFWIWCAAEAAEGSNGGYQNENACQGSMYFYFLQKRSSSVIGQVSEGPDGIYTMNVIQGTFAQLKSGTLNPSFACRLTNIDPDTKGTGHKVDVHCDFVPALGGGSGDALVDNAVVNVTGP